MTHKTHRYFCHLLLLASLFCTAVHFFFLFHASPARDDFNRASVAGPLVKSVIEFHQTWSGRWSATALQIALGRNFDLIGHYPALIFPFTLIFFLGCLGFISLVAAPSATRFARIGLAWLLSCLIWLNLPEPGEVLYWLTGAVEYLLPVMLGVIVLAWLARAEASRPTLRYIHAAGLALATLFMTGLHDILGLYFICVLLLILIYRLARKMKAGLLPLLIAVAAAGFLLTIATPGVSARRAAYASLAPEAGGLLLRGLLKTAQIFCAQFLLAPSLILGSLLVLAAGAGRQLGPRWLERDRAFFRIAFPILAIASPLGLMLVVMLGGLYDPPPRLVDAAFIIFVFGWVLGLIAWMPPEPVTLAPRARRLLSAAFVLFILAFFTSGNSYRAASDAVMRLRPYARATHARTAQMRSAAADPRARVTLAPLPRRPLLYPDAEISPDPGHPLNRGYAAFFGVASVRLNDPHAR
ncbi:MAG: DUF6056 family protein [Candidatus Sumerlaeia bacterium]